MLTSEAWRRAFNPAGIKEVNQVALADALRDWRETALPKRFSREESPVRLRVTWITVLNRAKDAYRRNLRNVPGAPDLHEFYERSFGGWDPWSRLEPPIDRVQRRNSALLKAGGGGYQRSTRDTWTRAKAEYRQWAKQLTRNMAQRVATNYDPLVLEGVLRASVQTGRIKVSGTAKKTRGVVTMPRAGRQNKQVIRVLGGGGKGPVVPSSEWKRMTEVLRASIVASVTGKASKLPAKRGRKAKK